MEKRGRKSNKVKELVGTFKILKEIERKYVDMEIEMDDETRSMMIVHALENMSDEDRDSMFISWALEDIIKRKVKEV